MTSTSVKTLVIGGSKNIGYHSALRLLESGTIVTFFLRNPHVFDNDQVVQTFIKQGKARLVQGDALVREDVQRAWGEAAQGNDDAPVDLCLFTVGGTPHFHLTKGFVISPPNLVTQSLLNVLTTLPSSPPRLVVISSLGVTRASHAALPLPLKPFYSYFLAMPHQDKYGTECAVAHCVGLALDGEADEEMLGVGWRGREGLPARGAFKRVVVIRPAFLTNGECRAEGKQGKASYRAHESDLKGAWTVSRRDVAHFVVEGVVKEWDRWEGKIASIGY